MPYNSGVDITNKVALFFEKYPLQSFSKRELLVQADQPIRSVFYIVNGRVSEYDIAPNGNEIVVNVFKPGAFFPVSSAINDTPNPYFFEASLNTTVRVAPKAHIVRFLQDNPDVMFDLLARVYRGVDGILRRMAHLMGGDAQSRLIFELLNAAYRFGQLQSDGSTLLSLTETDIARHSGLVRETVSRNMSILKKGGLLEVSPAGIILKDVKKLETTLGTGL